ncbi:MAG: hypothetical protein ACKO2T_22740, partial [Microcystis aeruginosa]
GAPIDDAIQIDDLEALRVVYQLLRKDGLFMGGSTGSLSCADNPNSICSICMRDYQDAISI